jgi:hypothetical protein
MEKIQAAFEKCERIMAMCVCFVICDWWPLPCLLMIASPCKDRSCSVRVCEREWRSNLRSQGFGYLLASFFLLMGKRE